MRHAGVRLLHPAAPPKDGGGDLSAAAISCPANCREGQVLSRLKPLLEDASVLKIAQNMKYDWLIFKQRGIAVTPVEDTMLLSYVLDVGRTDHGMDVLSEKHLGHKPIPFSEVAGSGRSFIGFARVAIDKATEYSAEDADVTLRLWRVLKPRLPAEHMTHVYETLERPMAEVLARMEERGIMIDRAFFHGSRANSRRTWRGLRARVTSLQAKASISARRNSSAIFSMARWACLAPRRPRPVLGRRRRACLRISPSKAMNSRPHPRLAPAFKTEIDLYRCPALLRRSQYGARAHLLCARRDDDRQALFVGPESAKHPGAQ